MTTRRPAKSHNVKPVKSGDMARDHIAKYRGLNAPIRTQTMWVIRGELCGFPITRRISAPDYDAAITEAHADKIRVHTCTQIQETRK